MYRSRRFGVDVHGLKVAREVDDGLLAAGVRRKGAQIRREVSSRDGAVRVLEDDAREADLREFESELAAH